MTGLSPCEASFVFPDALQTARLVFRPITAADAPPIFDNYAQDPDVSMFLTWRPHTSVEETTAYVTSCIASMSSRTYALVGRYDNKLVGTFDLRRVASHCVGFGYVLKRSSWGHGLMTEALTEAACWALAQDAVWRIGDVCDVENLASARVMEKAGLSREGLLRRWCVHPNMSNIPRDCVSFAKVR